MKDMYMVSGIPPRTIQRWSKWIDVADRTTRYLVTADTPDGSHSIPVRLISDATHPAAGQTFYVSRAEFGRQLRRVNG
jgi:hypothetical protein